MCIFFWPKAMSQLYRIINLLLYIPRHFGNILSANIRKLALYAELGCGGCWGVRQKWFAARRFEPSTFKRLQSYITSKIRSAWSRHVPTVPQGAVVFLPPIVTILSGFSFHLIESLLSFYTRYSCR